MRGTVRIGPELTDPQRQQVAALYHEAFARKLRPAMPDEAAAIRLLADTLHPGSCAVVIDHDHTVLGVAGFRVAGQRFIDPTPGDLVRHLGWLGGLRALALLLPLSREEPAGVLQMDGLAVRADTRGQGAGSRLLDAMETVAKRHGLTAVRLEVVDTNPRAAALYARRGFTEVGRIRVPGLRHLYGFDGAVTMDRPVR